MNYKERTKILAEEFIDNLPVYFPKQDDDESGYKLLEKTFTAGRDTALPALTIAVWALDSATAKIAGGTTTGGVFWREAIIGDIQQAIEEIKKLGDYPL